MKRAILATLLILATGCMILPRYRIAASWDRAVASGAYTFDHAVVDLGPPTESLDLESGGRVSVWRSVREYTNPGEAFTAGYQHRATPIHQQVQTIKLVFDGRHILRAWSWDR